MRITGGTARGIPLVVPHGDAVRPATDGMRQAVFSSLAPRLPGARVLDLFAGSGGYGLEALSRGAEGATFVERNPKALRCLRTNLAAVCKSIGRSPQEASAILAMDALTAPLSTAGIPDLVFIDPPWESIQELAPALFDRLCSLFEKSLDPLVVFEMPGELDLQPAGWTAVKRLGKGARQPSAVFFRKNP